MRIIIIPFDDLRSTKNKKVSEIGLICIYTLPATHCRRTIVITCMFGCVCGVSYGSIFVIWIWSWNLFTYFIAILRYYSWRSYFLFWMLLNMNISFALTIFHIVLISAHDSTIIFYFGCLMNYTIIRVLIYMIRWVQSALKTIGCISTSRL